MRCHARRVVPLAGLALGFLLLPRAAAAQSTIAGLVTLPRWILFSDGNSQSGYNNFAMVQDATYQTSSIGADSAGGGVRINTIPREGGNTIRPAISVRNSGPFPAFRSGTSSNSRGRIRCRGVSRQARPFSAIREPPAIPLDPPPFLSVGGRGR